MNNIKTDAEYQAALKRVEELLTLMELIEDYEAKHFPLLEDDNTRDMTNEVMIIDDIILSAHKRIAMYQTLQEGLWRIIFGIDNTDEILKERKLIREYEKMREEMIEWNKLKDPHNIGL